MSIVGCLVLTISLCENIPGRLSKVDVGGRYCHYLQRERPWSQQWLKTRQKTKEYNSLSETWHPCCPPSAFQLQDSQSHTAEGETREPEAEDTADRSDVKCCWKRKAGASGGHWWMGAVQIWWSYWLTWATHTVTAILTLAHTFIQTCIPVSVAASSHAGVTNT